MKRAAQRLTPLERAALRPRETCTVSPDGRVVFAIQRPLKNYNSGNRHPHWSKKHKSMKVWQTALQNAAVLSLGMKRAQALLGPDSGLFGAKAERCTERRRIEIVRLVPSKRNFVRDTFENLPFAAKELRDALKHTGLIFDDSTSWTDTVISQDVSTDGTYWTLVTVSPCAAAGAIGVSSCSSSPEGLRRVAKAISQPGVISQIRAAIGKAAKHS